MRPWPKSLLHIFLWSQVYLVAAATFNWLFATNYGYLCAKPAHPSLLDYLGPWPFYILGTELLAAVSFLIYYSPFFVADRFRNKASGGS
jgi:uncharacterized membrane protein YwaF